MFNDLNNSVNSEDPFKISNDLIQIIGSNWNYDADNLNGKKLIICVILHVYNTPSPVLAAQWVNLTQNPKPTGYPQV